MREFTDKEKNLIIELEDSLHKAHLGADRETRMHWCRYCGNIWKWSERIVHRDDCPITVLNTLRKIGDIPNSTTRISEKMRVSSSG